MVAVFDAARIWLVPDNIHDRRRWTRQQGAAAFVFAEQSLNLHAVRRILKDKAFAESRSFDGASGAGDERRGG